MVSVEWLEPSAVFKGERPAVSLVFLVMANLFLLQIWWLEVPVAALLANLLFIAAIVTTFYVMVLPRLIALLSGRSTTLAETDKPVMFDETALQHSLKRLAEWLKSPAELNNTSLTTIINVLIRLTQLLLLIILRDSIVSCVNVLNIYFVAAVGTHNIDSVLNGHFGMQLLNKRGGSKFNYTFNDVMAIAKDLLGGALSKVPRYVS